MQDELADAHNVLPSLSVSKNSLYEEVCELERKQGLAKSSFDLLSELGRKIRQEQDKLAEIKNLCNKADAVCSEQLQKELTLCVDFLYKPMSEETASLFNELSKASFSNTIAVIKLM